MSLDLNKMRLLIEDLYVAEIARRFGNEGMRALRQLIDTLVHLYRTLDPAERQGALAVFVRPHEGPLGAALPSSPVIGELAGLPSLTHEADDPCFIEVTAAGRLRIYHQDAFDPVSLSSEAIVYVYRDGAEHFYIQGQNFKINNPSSVHASIFARPTFSSLEAALENYRTRVALDTTCFILEEAWAEPNRLFLRPRPEATMRRSLHQYLRTVFTEAEVRPEQVVDESHPVDIKITWADTNRRALVEIKWLGKSRDENGHITVTYTDARARDGAQQLADYLDGNKTAGPGLRTRGYLVVFDARRRGLSEDTTNVSEADGYFYRDKDVAYNPLFHQTRRDFATPVRFFANPKVS